MGNVEDSVLRRYVQYLCLERSYSKNTLDAYKRDLQKLLVFYADNHIDYRTKGGKTKCGNEWMKAGCGEMIGNKGVVRC